MTYFFILGKNSTLSITEIVLVLKRKETTFQIIELASTFLIIKCNKLLPNQLIIELGGTIKIGQIINQFNSFNEIKVNNVLPYFPKLKEKKIQFGFSAYFSNKRQIINKIEFEKLALTIKNKLRVNGWRTRWVDSKEPVLSSVVVAKNKLLSQQGREFVFLFTNTDIYLGQTLAVQPFAQLSWRDWQRPAKMINSGMIPPKLAKIMINFALPINKTIEQIVLLDPFCGVGTILQESILSGVRNLIGSDINQQAIQSTKQNLDWLIDNYSMSDINYQLKLLDVCQLSKKINQQSVDLIVTEPYLGPLRLPTTPGLLDKVITDLSSLYLSAFQQFSKILAEGGKIAIIFPVFKRKNSFRTISMPDQLISQIKSLGFQNNIDLPIKLYDYSIMKFTRRKSIIYSRPNQQVLREIFVWQKA